MRTTLAVAALAILIGGRAMAKDDPSSDPVSLGAVHGRGVAGHLGQRLGTIVTVTGTVVANESRAKADVGKEELLHIETVDGKKLPTPVSYPFRPAASWLTLTAPKLGARFTLVGYESGGFVGSPEGEFEHVPAYTTTMYHFETHFLVLKVE